jgi:hypothetical protein
MKSIATFFLCLAIAFCIGGSFLVSPVHAQTTKEWTGRCVKSAEGFDDIATIQGLECLFYNVLQVIVTIAGLAFLFMFISGGFKYLFSGSEQKAVASASSTLTNAFIGLIGVIASWLILKLIQDFTGINITIFKIPG